MPVNPKFPFRLAQHGRQTDTQRRHWFVTSLLHQFRPTKRIDRPSKQSFIFKSFFFVVNFDFALAENIPHPRCGPTTMPFASKVGAMPPEQPSARNGGRARITIQVSSKVGHRRLLKSKNQESWIVVYLRRMPVDLKCGSSYDANFQGSKTRNKNTFDNGIVKVSCLFLVDIIC